ncbi:hypothetical protein [uncultured Mediterranean phage uvMED]|nr:hypothetical protein [uncultured Mediterranean phage uvMED]
MKGWISLHRKFMDKAFYSKDSEKVHLWIHLLMKANHRGKEEFFNGKIIHCNPGQFTIGRKQLSEETGINESKIQRTLKYFDKIEQQIEQQTSSKNRLITILRWDDYQQSEHQSEHQVNNKRTTSEQQVNSKRTHYNNINNINNDNKFNFKKSFLDLGVEENILNDWLTVRVKKKASNTETSFKKIKKEIEKSNLTANESIRMSAENSWIGFNHNWIKKEEVEQGYFENR